MFKNFIPLASFNNWQSSWIMRVAESSYGKPLTGHKRNLFYSIFSGVFAGFILAASVLCFSIFLFNHNFTSELLLVFGAVFLKVTIFVFLVSMLLTEADDIKRIVKKNRKHEFLLSVLINSGAFIVVFILSLVFYSYYFTPSKYFSEIELSSQGCPNGKCEVSTIQPDLNISNVEETSENKLPKVEEEKEKNELGDGISFDALSIDEFDEFLVNSGFEDFSVKTTETKATSTFGEISLFPDKKGVDWGQFLAELDDVALNSPLHVDRKISSAIMKEVPFEIINDILNRGHELNGHHISSLARYFTVEEFQQLENYGIDLSADPSVGGSVLARSLLNKQGPELFDYLLTKDELVMDEDINVVKEVLSLSSKLNRPIKYTQQLIERGAPMTDETKEWIETDLRKKNLNYYVIVKSRLTY
ncbi:hypothetical protein EXT46_00235 [Pseudoalteromonas sp. CO325X]|uniref:hypothetical protein n=1 Tax=Pseudoalteromonas sp. CO325X TaxID=1777262 RepID=UPI001023214D|nr:hypothetical protein [Pseudoalteromonas sp. CO325X]RZF87916.1 hypothetical protein EXT46_00235 [Pseudoalteromonas sp. CO325X]